ncbi:MAG: GntR family transcriptional regulator [Lautropia sp.]
MGAAFTPGDDGVPLYVRLAASLRARIIQGEWPVGQRIPAFEELAASHGVAMNTVRKAIELLVHEGLLASARGRGTVVASSEARLLGGGLMRELHNPLSTNRELEINLVKFEPGATLPAILLDAYMPCAAYVRIVKTHAVRGMPYGYLDIFVEQRAYEQFPPDAMYRRKVTRLLRDFCPNDVLRTRQQLTIAYADDALAKILRCPPASALVRVRRWKLGENDRVVLACEIYYRGDTFVWDSTENESESQAIVPDVQEEDAQ